MVERASAIERAARRSARRWSALRGAAALAAVAPGVVVVGWDGATLAPATARWLQLAAIAMYAAFNLAHNHQRGLSLVAVATRTARRAPFEFFISLAGLLLGAVWWVAALAAGALAAIEALRLYFRLTSTRIPPGLLFVGSFLALILVGTLGLLMPASTPADKPISVLDAAFTITSAISQTGLVVRPTGEGFTRLGQIIVLIWIQVGALGVLAFGALIAAVIGRSFGLRATQTLAEGVEQGWAGQLSLKRLVVFIIIVTHAVELVGAIAFYFAWPATWEGAPEMTTPLDRFYHSVFFSVSAFCNAGFVTTANSMQGLRAHFSPHLILAPLIVIGSIGFPVLENLWRVLKARLRRRRIVEGVIVRLNFNAKLVLVATLAVYVLGYVLILVGELAQTTEPWSLVLLDAHFMTINRTSGFDTIAPADMGLLSRLSLILLMFIGGSPGSVAGGIKMMVFAVLALTVWSTILGKPATVIFGRTIPDDVVRKSATLIVLSLATVMAATGVLAATESAPLGYLLFEATSAFGTTGLSMGVTDTVNTPGQIALMVAMFVGRVGPLAALAALFSVARARRTRIEYPSGDVVIY